MPVDVVVDGLELVPVAGVSGVVAACPSVARVSDTSNGWRTSRPNSMVSWVASTESLNTASNSRGSTEEEKRKGEARA